MITIDEESSRRSKNPLDLDNMSPRYKTEYSGIIFTSPSLWTLQKNLFYLLRHSKKISFDQKYNFRPDYLAFDQYGNIILGPLLMYVNNIPSVEDFTMDVIMIPTLNAITQIIKDRHLNTKKTIQNTESVGW